MKASIMTAKETLRAILLNQIAMGMPNKTIQDSPEQNKKDFTHTLNMFERQLWLRSYSGAIFTSDFLCIVF